MSQLKVPAAHSQHKMHLPRLVGYSLCCLVCLALVGFSFHQQDQTPVSQFAPAEDLLAMANSYVADAATIVESPDEFAKSDQRTRVNELAEAIQVLTLALANHDKPADDSKPGGFAAAHKAAGELYAAADHAAATQAMQKLKDGIVGTLEQAELPKWGSTDQMYDLMNQVQLSMNAVNRGLRRLERRPEPVQQNAAFLAAAGHETNLLPPEGLSDELRETWHKLATEMRNSAGALNAAARAKDETAANEAAARLTTSCEDCHAQIRDAAPLFQ